MSHKEGEIKAGPVWLGFFCAFFGGAGGVFLIFCTCGKINAEFYIKIGIWAVIWLEKARPG